MRAVSWTLYGLVTSNLGKQENLLQLNNGQIVTVPEFLYNQFHYRHDMVGYIVLILAAFVAVFWTAGWAAFRYLNFNVSPRLPVQDWLIAALLHTSAASPCITIGAVHCSAAAARLCGHDS